MNYWGMFFMGGIIPMLLGLGGYMTYLFERTESEI